MPSRRRTGKRVVRLIQPEKPEARDEGPRLLPLEERQKESESRLQHYMDLANLALAPKKKKSNGQKKSD